MDIFSVIKYSRKLKYFQSNRWLLQIQILICYFEIRVCLYCVILCEFCYHRKYYQTLIKFGLLLWTAANETTKLNSTKKKHSSDDRKQFIWKPIDLDWNNDEMKKERRRRRRRKRRKKTIATSNKEGPRAKAPGVVVEHITHERRLLGESSSKPPRV